MAVLAGGFLISLSTFQYAPVPVLDGFAWCGGRTAVRFGDFVFFFSGRLASLPPVSSPSRHFLVSC